MPDDNISLHPGKFVYAESTPLKQPTETLQITDIDPTSQTISATYTTRSIPSETYARISFENTHATVCVEDINQLHYETINRERGTPIVGFYTTSDSVSVDITYSVENYIEFISDALVLIGKPLPTVSYYDFSEEKRVRVRHHTDISNTRSPTIEVYSFPDRWRLGSELSFVGSQVLTETVLYLEPNFTMSNPVTPKLSSVDGVTPRIYYSPTISEERQEMYTNSVVKLTEQIFNTINDWRQDHNFTILFPTQHVRTGGGALGRTDTYNSIWVNEFSNETLFKTVLAHELIHIQQNHLVADDLAWWIEGSARYLSGVYVNTVFDSIDLDTVKNRVYQSLSKYDTKSNSSQIDLSNSTTWNDSSVEYDAGSHIVRFIDSEIRAASNGTKSITDLLSWMNYRKKTTFKNPIDYEEFRSQIVQYTSEDVGIKLDSYTKNIRKIPTDSDQLPLAES